MKVDYYFPPAPPLAAEAAGVRAARLGYDGFFSAETTHDPFLPLLVAHRAAPDLDLGTAIAVAFPRSPMVVAQTAWDLAALSDGRFLLGLGTQVKAHIERRFSTAWTSPGPRLREYILSLRAIWSAFQEGTSLRFDGDFYRFSLLTPFFNPGPIPHPDVPVYIAGVGPYLSRLAGELCQGFHVHPFHTVRYLDEVVLPSIAGGAVAAGRRLEDVARVASVFVVTGHSEEEMAARILPVKQQIAFYASTPSYRPVLEAHGWDFGETLRGLSRRGRWDEMADVVPDEVVHEVAVVAPFDELGGAIRERYGDRLQRVGYYAMDGGATLTEEEWAAVVADTREGAQTGGR